MAKNPHLASLEVDNLYHIGYNTKEDLQGLFGDVRVILMGGSTDRMASVAKKLIEKIGKQLQFPDASAPNISRSDRYSMYKVGPVLCVSHGIGQPSLSIILHELVKLARYSGMKDPVFFRLGLTEILSFMSCLNNDKGTSGGIGLEPGTVVLTTQGVNCRLELDHTSYVLGKELFDEGLAADILTCAPKDVALVTGKTMTCDDFYEGQGRTDGAVCDYSAEEKFAFLHSAQKAGVANIEMEVQYFGAFLHYTGFRAAALCVTLLNRLKGDQVPLDHDEVLKFSDDPIAVAIAYISKFIIGKQ